VLCPIETPEVQTSFGYRYQLPPVQITARLLGTPYRKIVDGKMTDESVIFCDFSMKLNMYAQASAMLNSEGRLVDELVTVRPFARNT